MAHQLGSFVPEYLYYLCSSDRNSAPRMLRGGCNLDAGSDREAQI